MAKFFAISMNCKSLIVVFYAFKKRLSTDFETVKFKNVLSGLWLRLQTAS